MILYSLYLKIRMKLHAENRKQYHENGTYLDYICSVYSESIVIIIKVRVKKNVI